jgi:hypothetical protein
VLKSVGVYASVVVLNKSGVSQEDTILKVQDFYLAMQRMNQAFSFLHCWLILREVPCWKITLMRQPLVAAAMDINDNPMIKVSES